MMADFRLCALAVLLSASALGQPPAPGKQDKLFFHEIATDAQGHMLPWYSPDPGKSYDHVLGLLWTYWKNMPDFWENTPGYEKAYPKRNPAS